MHWIIKKLPAFPEYSWNACPAFFELPNHVFMYTSGQNVTFLCPISQMIMWWPVKWICQMGSTLTTITHIVQFGTQRFLSHICIDCHAKYCNCDSLSLLWVLLSMFKINQSFLFPLLAWQDSISFLETTVVKLLNKRATGLYSIPWLLQHTFVPPAISCWCLTFVHSGWIGHIVYKDGRCVKLTYHMDNFLDKTCERAVPEIYLWLREIFATYTRSTATCITSISINVNLINFLHICAQELNLSYKGVYR